MCRKAIEDGDDDEGGSGGLQLQLQKNAKQLQLAIDQDSALQKELIELDRLEHEKNSFGVSKSVENEQKNQTAQRELLDIKETPDQDAEPNNPDYTEDTKVKREKITRLFAVTRLLSGNYRATNNAKAIVQKNLSIFSQTKEHKTAATAQQINQANTSKALSAESSTLFSQPHSTKESTTNEVEKLANAIREGQKIFNK